jgi:hypothetical protein
MFTPQARTFPLLVAACCGGSNGRMISQAFLLETKEDMAVKAREDRWRY